MAVPRETPYIWTTWLPRLLTGENSCEWAVWFKAHHSVRIGLRTTPKLKPR